MLHKDETISLDGWLVYNNHKSVKSVKMSFNNFFHTTNKLLIHSCCQPHYKTHEIKVTPQLLVSAITQSVYTHQSVTKL